MALFIEEVYFTTVLFLRLIIPHRIEWIEAERQHDIWSFRYSVPKSILDTVRNNTHIICLYPWCHHKKLATAVLGINIAYTKTGADARLQYFYQGDPLPQWYKGTVLISQGYQN